MMESEIYCEENADEKLKKLGYIKEDILSSNTRNVYRKEIPTHTNDLWLEIRRNYVSDFRYFRKEKEYPKKGGYNISKLLGPAPIGVYWAQSHGITAEEMQILAQRAMEMDAFFEANPDKLWGEIDVEKTQ